MAAPKENLMSLGNLTGADRNTFTQQRQPSLKHSFHGPMLVRADFSTPQSRQHLREMHLRRQWQQLTERERSAQQHNRQLLQQFDTAQDVLRELLARNAAMKTVRLEYEKYLEESAPQWQQHLKEKTAQRKRMEEYLRSCLKNSEEEQMRKSSAEQLLLLQGLKPQNCSALQENNKQNSRSDNNQEFSPHLPCHSSWLTNTQTQSARFPTNMPHQPQGSSLDLSSHLPPSSILPHFNQFHHLAPMLAHLPLWPRQDQPGWASLQSDNPLSWTAGATGIPSAFEALWGQLHMDEPPHERLVEAETRRAPRETGGESRSSHCSQELDINPVRLSSGQAESSESGRDSSQSSREKWKKREKRGKAKRTSSDRERCSSQGLPVQLSLLESQWSKAMPRVGTAGQAGARGQRGGVGGLAVGSPQIEKVANDKTKSEGEDSESHKEESHSTGEESGSQREDSTSKDAENQRPVDKSDREEESESDSVKIENGDAEKEMQESNSGAEQNSEEEIDEEEEEHKNDLGDGEEKKKSQRDEEKDVRHVDDDDDDVSGRKNTTEEEQTEAEEELEDQGDDEDRIKDEDGEKRKQGSASSQDEEDERVENKVCEVEEGSDEEEDGEGEEEEEQRSDEAGEEESDSDDSIISPQENRLKKIHIIPEEVAEDDDDDDKSGSKTGSSDRDELSENDIENLLAPQQQTKKTGKDLKVDDKAKATCDYVEIFQVEDNSKKTDQQSDSDEFDDFYD